MTRLRRWLLGGTVVFAAILVAFIGVARYRARKAILNLPHRLGLDIKSETNGFTISRAFKGHTQFVVHAAKGVQHQDGTTTLHDVAITLYGSPGSNRADSIRGSEFDYDQNNGILRSTGDTVLDIAAPQTDGQHASTDKRMTVHARGLVLLEKLGVASTKEQIRFEYGSMRGEAVGADYERDTGLVTLHHDVHLRSEENGHLEQVDADSAELQQLERTAVLHRATLRDANDTLSSPLLRAVLRPSGQPHAGTLQQVHATGGVSVHTSTGEQMDAPELIAAVDEQNRLRELQMQGGVRMRGNDLNAGSSHARVAFANGRATHLLLDGNAHLDQSGAQQQARTLQAQRIEGDLASTGTQHLALRNLTATGGAVLVMTQPNPESGRMERTQLSAPLLVAHSTPGATGLQLTDLQVPQGARLLQDDGHGSQSSSSSDRLVAKFQPGTTGTPSSSLQSVVEDGNVVIHDLRSATTAAPGQPARAASHTEARAQHAEFQVGTDLLTLTGSPDVNSDGMQLAAERITVHRDTGDADATGSVRGSVTQASNPGGNSVSASTAPRAPQDPARFAAASAHLSHASGTVVLTGGASDARLWTSTGQVEAPVIEADQRTNTLRAHGTTAVQAGPVVRTVLAQATTPPASQSSSRPVPSSQTASSSPAEGLTRIFSHDLVYTSAVAGKRAGTAEFRGGVRLLQGGDTITADAATATLRGGALLSGGGVDTITAQNHVRVMQKNRTATGDRLVYTVADRRAVLTGSPGALPTARDPVQGVITGSQIVLQLGEHAGDNSVQVTGAANAPVRTELDVPDKSTSTAPSGSRPRRKSRPTP